MTDAKLVCYSFADSTYEFNGQTTGDYDPLDDRNILWPRNTTQVKPPAFNPGVIPVFNAKTQKWFLVSDYRGQTGYAADGSPVLITSSGDPSKFNPPLSINAPDPVPPDPVPPEQTDDEKNYALRTSKVAFFRRCTDAEAAQFVADLTDASPRLKAIFDSVSYLIPGTEEYPNLRAAIEARVTPERADELLAPSND